MVTSSGRRIGAYELVEAIGRGGSAVVYRAYDAARRPVAVKIISGAHAADPTFLARFRQEAELISQLSHPHILRVLDSGQVDDTGWGPLSDGIAYLVTEFMPGGSLADGDLSSEPARERCLTALAVAQQIGAALDWAHAAGVLHRDVKTSNVLIADDGRFVLGDFGLARVLQSGASMHLTATGLVAGTPAYMAPEQALGEPADSRTDVYSLGVVLYEILTGRVPFDAESPMAVMMAQVHQPAPPLTDLSPDVPGPIGSVILHALAKDREARPQSAAELATLLRAAVASCYGESAITTGTFAIVPNESRPGLVRAPAKGAVGASTTSRQRAARRPRRRQWRLPAIAAGLVLAAAVAGAGGVAALAGPGRLRVAGMLSRFVEDTVPLGVTSAFPRENTRNQGRQQSINIVFNKPMDQESVQAAFRLEALPSHELVPVDFVWEGQALQITPQVELEYSTAYRFVVARWARDLEGRELSADLERHFTTVAEPARSVGVVVAQPAPPQPTAEPRPSAAPATATSRPPAATATTPQRSATAPVPTATLYTPPTLPPIGPSVAQVAGLVIDANGTPHMLDDGPDADDPTPAPPQPTATLAPITVVAPSATAAGTAVSQDTAAAATATAWANATRAAQANATPARATTPTATSGAGALTTATALRPQTTTTAPVATVQATITVAAPTPIPASAATQASASQPTSLPATATTAATAPATNPTAVATTPPATPVVATPAATTGPARSAPASGD